MTMNVHAIGAMYAPRDMVTLMAIGSFSKLSMDHVTRTNTTFTTESSGIGDLSISSLVSLYRGGSVRAHLHAGVWLPTGSITAAGVTPASMGEERQLPYPMQLGSGTLDVNPGLTLLGAGPSWCWGAQTTGRFPVGDNDRGLPTGIHAQRHRVVRVAPERKGEPVRTYPWPALGRIPRFRSGIHQQGTRAHRQRGPQVR